MAGQSLEQALPKALAGSKPQDQGFIRALCYGVLREQRLLTHLSNQLLSRPLKSKGNRGQAELLQLILTGLFQLRSMRVPPHAAVAETVAACNSLGQARARGLVNAVLRRYQREADQLTAALPDNPAITQSHPDWMVELIKQDWPRDWPRILAANQEPGPMILRTNKRRIPAGDYLQQLSAAGIKATVLPDAPQAIQLEEAVDVHNLPGFDEGLVSVQDVAAQLAAPLLLHNAGETSGLRLLDACAAPGGKTAHLLELQPQLQLTALDKDAERLQRVADNLQRLGLNHDQVKLQAADAGDPDDWWDGMAYDRILLDAPCSGSGVIRRHPDIKWLRRPADIPQLAGQQSRLFRALWPLLNPGGLLLYATCSIFKTEGEAVVDAFLESTPDAQADAIDQPSEISWGVTSGAGRAILPGAMDGFFYARLRKAV